jgi:hypothetical protein
VIGKNIDCTGVIVKDYSANLVTRFSLTKVNSMFQAKENIFLDKNISNYH